MKLVVDANTFFAALARQGLTAKTWFNPQLRLYAPAFILVEFSKYKPMLERKFRGSPKEFEEMVGLLVKQVEFIADEQLAPFLPGAASLITDKKDWLYLACALKENADIWTRDKGFNGQKRVATWTTEKLAKEIGTL